MGNNLYQEKNAIYDPLLLSEEGGTTSNERFLIVFLNEVMSVATHIRYICSLIKYIRKGMGTEHYRCKREELGRFRAFMLEG